MYSSMPTAYAYALCQGLPKCCWVVKISKNPDSPDLSSNIGILKTFHIMKIEEKQMVNEVVKL